jgi:hypothetical protein
MNYACATALQCYGPLWTLSFDTELVHCIVALFGMAFVYFFLFLYLDAVLPREYGIPKHPLFFLHSLADLWRSLFKKKRKSSLLADENMVEDIDDNTGIKEDNDVQTMRREVEAGRFSVDDPLIAKNLRKIYDDGKLALANLNLIVHKNSCFGLLGENGAVRLFKDLLRICVMVEIRVRRRQYRCSRVSIPRLQGLHWSADMIFVTKLTRFIWQWDSVHSSTSYGTTSHRKSICSFTGGSRSDLSAFLKGLMLSHLIGH